MLYVLDNWDQLPAEVQAKVIHKITRYLLKHHSWLARTYTEH